MIRCLVLVFLLTGCAASREPFCTAWRPVMSKGYVVGEVCKTWVVKERGWRRSSREAAL